jgi:hypothetical protein
LGRIYEQIHEGTSSFGEPNWFGRMKQWRGDTARVRPPGWLLLSWTFACGFAAAVNLTIRFGRILFAPSLQRCRAVYAAPATLSN